MRGAVILFLVLSFHLGSGVRALWAADECPRLPVRLASTQICWLGFPIVGQASTVPGDPPITEIHQRYRLGLKGNTKVYWQMSDPAASQPTADVCLGPPLVQDAFHGPPLPWMPGPAPQPRIAADVDLCVRPGGQVVWRFRGDHAPLTEILWLGSWMVGVPDPTTPAIAQTVPLPMLRLGVDQWGQFVWQDVPPQ